MPAPGPGEKKPPAMSKRAIAAWATGAVSASEYDQSAAGGCRQSDPSAARAQATVAQNATGYTKLLADSDGVVMETLAEPGQVVSAGQAVIRLACFRGNARRLSSYQRHILPSVVKRWQTRYGSEAQPVTMTLRLLSDAADTTTRTYEARYVLKACWLTRRWVRPSPCILNKNAERQVMQVPLASLGTMGKARRRISRSPQSDVAARQRAERERRCRAGDGRRQTREKIVALGAHLLHDGEAVRLAEQRGTAQAGSQP